MSFIYCLIARSKSILLTEYSGYTGNFPQISMEYLKKVKPNTKYTKEEKE
jgi:hypothetical protein